MHVFLIYGHVSHKFKKSIATETGLKNDTCSQHTVRLVVRYCGVLVGDKVGLTERPSYSSHRYLPELRTCIGASSGLWRHHRVVRTLFILTPFATFVGNIPSKLTRDLWQITSKGCLQHILVRAGSVTRIRVGHHTLHVTAVRRGSLLGSRKVTRCRLRFRCSGENHKLMMTVTFAELGFKLIFLKHQRKAVEVPSVLSATQVCSLPFNQFRIPKLEFQFRLLLWFCLHSLLGKKRTLI